MSWDKHGKYEDLEALLAKEGRYGSLQYLPERNDLAGRKTAMVSLFRRASKADDDSGAAAAMRYVMQAIEDIHLKPHVNVNGSLCTRLASAAIVRVGHDKAVEAMDLLIRLPRKRDKEVWVPINEDRDMEQRVVEAPALTETKKLLLAEIIRQWHETKDESEADGLFSFLCGLRFDYGGDRDMLVGLMREQGSRGKISSTGRVSVSLLPERAARNYLVRKQRNPRENPYGMGQDELAKTLAMAWIRNSDDKRRVNWIRAVVPAFGCSDAVFDALADKAGILAGIDREVVKFRGELNPVIGFDGKMEVSYSFFGPRDQKERVAVRLSVRFGEKDRALVGYVSASRAHEFNQENAHRKFEEIKEKAKEKRAAIDCSLMELEMVVTGGLEGGETVFRRNCII
jgi:hypothetical protein